MVGRLRCPRNWPTCGRGVAAIKRIRRPPSKCIRGFDLTRGRLWGPKLSAGRSADRSSPLNAEEMAAHSLYIADLGDFSVSRFVERREAGRYTLHRRAGPTRRVP